MFLRKKTILFLSVFAALVIYTGCKKDDPYLEYSPTPYELVIPCGFPPMPVPADNPMTVEGVWLGRNLFWEKKLSKNNVQSCGTCHAPDAAFSDTAQFSTGVDGMQGNRQAMALVNLGWSSFFFWDGRVSSLEQQVLKPVPNPIEMNLPWPEAVRKLQEDDEYPLMFYQAFGTYTIDSMLVAKAIAQFMRTMISGNSKFDKYACGTGSLTSQELQGLNLFNVDRNIPGGIMGADCFHCHNYPFMQLQNEFHNNALDVEPFADLGRGGITMNVNDNGRFKVPTLRNIAVSAPYMHDGRFTTLDEVINHYSTGLNNSSTVSPLMLNIADGGVQLPPAEKAALKAFLETLTDWEFINNPDFRDPHIAQ
jgi:cytochrome c peroxidase